MSLLTKYIQGQYIKHFCIVPSFPKSAVLEWKWLKWLPRDLWIKKSHPICLEQLSGERSKETNQFAKFAQPQASLWAVWVHGLGIPKQEVGSSGGGDHLQERLTFGERFLVLTQISMWNSDEYKWGSVTQIVEKKSVLLFDRILQRYVGVDVPKT